MEKIITIGTLWIEKCFSKHFYKTNEDRNKNHRNIFEKYTFLRTMADVVKLLNKTRTCKTL